MNKRTHDPVLAAESGRASMYSFIGGMSLVFVYA